MKDENKLMDSTHTVSYTRYKANSALKIAEVAGQYAANVGNGAGNRKVAAIVDSLELMDDTELTLLTGKIEAVLQHSHNQKYETFVRNVQALKVGDDFTAIDMTEIYAQRIDEFNRDYKILSQAEIAAYLPQSKDSSVSRVANTLVEARKMVRVTMSGRGRKYGYPEFQFVSKGQGIKPIVSEVLSILSADFADWDLVFWFDAYHEALAATVLDKLDDESAFEAIRQLARNEMALGE